MILNDIEELIGNTPLLRLDGAKFGLQHTDFYIKLEYLNPFGSIKDRTALALIEGETIERPDGTKRLLLESSSGNTAKALQMLALKCDTKLVTVTNRIKVPEVLQTLQYIGAEVISLPGRSECPDPNDEGNALNVIKKMELDSPDLYVHTQQYENPANTEVHMRTTAEELYRDLGEIDAIVTGVGTGGSSGGCIEYIRKHGKSTECIGMLATMGDFLPGVRNTNELFETRLFDEAGFDELVEVSTSDGLDALEQLVKIGGVMAGPTTGANFAAALVYARAHDEKPTDGRERRAIVVIACDRLESYFSYIAKRRPDVFGQKNHTDIFEVLPGDIDYTAIEREADETLAKDIADGTLLGVDTRGVRPFSQFYIDGCINFPETALREILEQGTPFNTPVVFVCPNGDRSALLAHILRGRGVEAYSLKGGLRAWRAARLPLKRKGA